METVSLNQDKLHPIRSQSEPSQDLASNVLVLPGTALYLLELDPMKPEPGHFDNENLEDKDHVSTQIILNLGRCFTGRSGWRWRWSRPW